MTTQGTKGSANWGRFAPDHQGVCQSCGRTIAWHAGYGCFSPDSTGMPRPQLVAVQLELGEAA